MINFDALVYYKLRNIYIPTLLERIEYRRLGTMERNIYDVLVEGMKDRKIS